MSFVYNRLSSDLYAYYKKFDNDDFIILLLYVNDMLIADSNNDHIANLKTPLLGNLK